MIHIYDPVLFRGLCEKSILDGPGHHFVETAAYADCPECLELHNAERNHMSNDQRWVLQYPKNAPKDGEFGTDEEAYAAQYSEGFVSMASGYPAPVKDIQQATWFDTAQAAKEVAGPNKHLKSQPLNAVVGKKESASDDEENEKLKTEIRELKAELKELRKSAKDEKPVTPVPEGGDPKPINPNA